MNHRLYAWTTGAIAALVLFVYGLSAGLVIMFRVPWDMSLPLPVRGLGLVLVVAGAATFAWLLKYRNIREIFESTYATWVKLLRRASIEDRSGRTEPLVVLGPYRYVRHPMYTAIGTMALGIGLAVDHTFALIGATLLCLWFAFVIAPFEERELKALFGPAYEHYMRTTPRMIPLPGRRFRGV